VAEIHRPFVQSAPRWYPPRDGDCAEDDALRQWVHHCTLCGDGRGIMYQTVVYLARFTVFAVQCSACSKHDPSRQQLHRFLTTRYG
jgi:hypothetical protein